jgi:outer membrane protein TolC
MPLTVPVQVEDVADMPDSSPPAVSLESAWKTAEQERAELRIADETLKALGFEESAKRTEYFPKLFVRGGYDYAENRYQVHEGNWSVTLGLNISIFNGGETAAALKKIGYQKEKLLEQREKLRDEIRLEVEQYLLQSVTARERLNVTKDAEKQAEENLRINRVKYEEGIGTGTDVLDAVSLLSVARTNHYAALYDLRKSEAAVYYATGKDLLEVYR